MPRGVVAGLKETLGFAAPTCSFKDLIGSELIVIIGSQLPNNQPVSTKYLREAKRGHTNHGRQPVARARRSSATGSRATCARAVRHALHGRLFPGAAGGDIAFMSGVLKALDEIGRFDQAFVGATHRRLRRRARRARRSSLRDARARRRRRRAPKCGNSPSSTRARRRRVRLRMGLTQYEFGVDNVKAVVNLALARGMLGREKCGVMPIRGHRACRARPSAAPIRTSCPAP